MHRSRDSDTGQSKLSRVSNHGRGFPSCTSARDRLYYFTPELVSPISIAPFARCLSRTKFRSSSSVISAGMRWLRSRVQSALTRVVRRNRSALH